MIGKDASEKKSVTMSEAASVLEERKKDGELGYEQKLAFDHVKKFAKLSSSEAKKMKEEIVDTGLSDATATKVVDIMPVDITQLRQVLIFEKKQLEEELVSSIMKIVEGHRGK